jgi:hypothetical protein
MYGSSPARAAARLEPRGWRLVLPILHVVAALFGLAGLVGCATGVLLRPFLASVVAVAHPEMTPAHPGIPPVASAMAALSAVLFAWGLMGIVRNERRERQRARLLARAESFQRPPFGEPAGWEDRRVA